MGASKPLRDPIPDRFKSVEEFEEFWSTHSLADYDDIQRDVHFNITLGEDEFVPVKGEIARELAKRARQRKISVSELVNQLLEEKLREPA
ncbi:MAG: hypothetical protein HY741_29215 [Chloroflexi bacterium]|nr:hypothetical protein [Chloroflexota bacterium]